MDSWPRRAVQLDSGSNGPHFIEIEILLPFVLRSVRPGPRVRAGGMREALPGGVYYVFRVRIRLPTVSGGQWGSADAPLSRIWMQIRLRVALGSFDTALRK